MTTQFPDAVSDSNITVVPASRRMTPEPARPFSAVFQAGASAVIEGAEAAAQRLPGGPLMSAALRSEAEPGRSGVPGGGVPSGRPDGVPDELGGGESSMQSAIEAQTEASLYYLQLQNQVQEENRRYSTLSNVLKARHETVKNAIGNIR